MKNELVDSLTQLVRHSAKERFQHLSTGLCFVGDQIRHIEDEYPAWASIMVLGGNAFRIHLTLFYHAVDLFELGSRVSKIPALDFTRENLQDFVEEFCNLVAGAISGELHEQNIRARLGLPMASKGFGAPGVLHDSYVDWFELSTSETVILGKTTIYTFPDEPMPTFRFSEFYQKEQDIEDFFDFA